MHKAKTSFKPLRSLFSRQKLETKRSLINPLEHKNNVFLSIFAQFYHSMENIFQKLLQSILSLEVRIADLQRVFNQVELMMVGKTNELANTLKIHEQIIQINVELEDSLSLLRRQHQQYKQNKDVSNLTALLITINDKLKYAKHTLYYEENQQISQVLKLIPDQQISTIIKQLIHLIHVPLDCQSYLYKKTIQNLQFRKIINAKQIVF